MPEYFYGDEAASVCDECGECIEYEKVSDFSKHYIALPCKCKRQKSEPIVWKPTLGDLLKNAQKSSS